MAKFYIDYDALGSTEPLREPEVGTMFAVEPSFIATLLHSDAIGFFVSKH